MPSATALQYIEDALGLTSSLGTDQTLTFDETSDCLRKFNQLLDSWSAQNLAVYGAVNQTFNSVANLATYPIGPGSTWNADRPQRIWEPAYTVINGATFACLPWSQAEYNMVGVKDQPGQFPLRYLFINDFPAASITLWPVPSAIVPITFSIDRLLTQIAAVGTTVSFPPGYSDAFVYNLALRLAPLFGKRLSNFPDVVEGARESLGIVKRANRRPRVLQLDAAIAGLGGRRGWWGPNGFSG
jgi:hypothetical protein